MAFFYERGYYQAIAHLLTAGDVHARVVNNEEFTGIKVHLEDGSTVVWTNANPQGWAWTAVSSEGDQRVGLEKGIEIGASEEAVAQFIATYPYESAPQRATAD